MTLVHKSKWYLCAYVKRDILLIFISTDSDPDPDTELTPAEQKNKRMKMTTPEIGSPSSISGLLAFHTKRSSRLKIEIWNSTEHFWSIHSLLMTHSS
jgi:hypothetical protein